MTGCWFQRVLGLPADSCDGRLVMAHLLPKEKLRRELRGPRSPLLRERVDSMLLLDKILWDPRIIVMACGGPMGNGGHHGQFDSWALSVPWEKLPASLFEFAEEHGLEWMVDWRFGGRDARAG